MALVLGVLGGKKSETVGPKQEVRDHRFVLEDPLGAGRRYETREEKLMEVHP